MTNGGKCVDWDYTDLPEYMLLVIYIPTTAGTGSGVTFVAVITDEEKKYKMGIMDAIKLRPSITIADPELLMTLPPSLTASAGVDALSYAGVKKVKELNEKVKIPKLKDLNAIKEEHFRAIAECSAENVLSDDNAREIDADAYLELIYEAYNDK